MFVARDEQRPTDCALAISSRGDENAHRTRVRTSAFAMLVRCNIIDENMMAWQRERDRWP